MTEKSSGGILEYRNGLLVLSGFSGRVPQYFVRDERIQAYSSPAFRYSEAVSELEGVDDRVFPEREKIELSDVEGLRSYQKEAVRQWASNSSRGIVVLPTAAGKTHIGLAAISRLKCPTLVVAPTIELVRQWRERISRMFSVEVGMLGGGEKDLLQAL
ncbi:MAG: DEAD/DEAH box helicase family protein, partial [Candidatus Thermoplasmatota archaeon]|nr:DEAD/DEAH box helicase family protein [Candidatus Thermoplasmatota archaeon]